MMPGGSGIALASASLAPLRAGEPTPARATGGWPGETAHIYEYRYCLSWLADTDFQTIAPVIFRDRRTHA
jgi:hypothetical protein